MSSPVTAVWSVGVDGPRTAGGSNDKPDLLLDDDTIAFGVWLSMIR
jgi:hypothetical protein